MRSERWPGANTRMVPTDHREDLRLYSLMERAWGVLSGGMTEFDLHLK